jgi:hypothetical protein
LPIAASSPDRRTRSTEHRQDGHDYVERITQPNRAEQAKTAASNPSST